MLQEPRSSNIKSALSLHASVVSPQQACSSFYQGAACSHAVTKHRYLSLPGLSQVEIRNRTWQPSTDLYKQATAVQCYSVLSLQRTSARCSSQSLLQAVQFSQLLRYNNKLEPWKGVQYLHSSIAGSPNLEQLNRQELGFHNLPSQKDQVCFSHTAPLCLLHKVAADLDAAKFTFNQCCVACACRLNKCCDWPTTFCRTD